MRNILRLLLVITAVLIGSSCSSNKSSLSAFYSSETECLGTEYDGTLTLRVWGEGNTRNDAIEQAKKQAVHDVIFKGITRGVSDFHMRPLLTESNAEENHQDYFSVFFRDKGDYSKYVNFKDEKSNSRQKVSNRQVYKVGVTVRLLSSELKERLKADGLIKN
jgi:hypothetical protein